MKLKFCQGKGIFNWTFVISVKCFRMYLNIISGQVCVYRPSLCSSEDKCTIRGQAHLG